MLDARAIQAEIEKLHYWDARVISLSCNYFADEVSITHENDGGNVCYRFEGCYKVDFNHCLSYEKTMLSKLLSYAQIPYFLQNVTIEEVSQQGIKLYSCKINMHPLYVEILCKEIFILQPN